MPARIKSNTMYKDEWRTNPALFNKVQRAFPNGIQLDAAATSDNTLCSNFYDMGDNALEQDWYAPQCGITHVWLNPPFSLANEFLKKANEEWRKGATIVCLVRADAPETAWWCDNLLTSKGFLKHSVFYLRPRLQYFNESNRKVTGVSFPSCLILMSHNDLMPLLPRWIEWRRFVDFKYLFVQ